MRSDPGRPTATPTGRVAVLVGNVLAVVGVFFVLRTLFARIDALPALHPTPLLVAAVVAGVVVHVVATTLATSAWRALLHGAGVDHPWRDCFRALGASAVAKYVPGNVFHLVGRAAIASADGVATGIVVGTLALEAVLVLLAAGLVGLPAVVARGEDLVALLPGARLLVTIGVLGTAGVVVGVALAVRWRKRITTSARAVARAVALDVVTFVLLGGALALTLAALLDGGGLDLLVACVPAFAIAWALGFVVPGAPGGIGIRETVFVLLLPATDDGRGAAVILALVIARVQSIIGDVVVFVVARSMTAPSTAKAHAPGA